MPEEFRTLQIDQRDAATLYEALTLLSFFEAKPHTQALPYDSKSIAALQERVLTRWPELKPAYVGNRAERRTRR